MLIFLYPGLHSNWHRWTLWGLFFLPSSTLILLVMLFRYLNIDLVARRRASWELWVDACCNVGKISHSSNSFEYLSKFDTSKWIFGKHYVMKICTRWWFLSLWSLYCGIDVYMNVLKLFNKILFWFALYWVYYKLYIKFEEFIYKKNGWKVCSKLVGYSNFWK